MTHYKEQSPEKVAEYEKKSGKLPKTKGCMLMKPGLTANFYRQYARAPRGEKIHEKVKGRKY